MKQTLVASLLIPFACMSYAAESLSVKLDQATSITLYGTLDAGLWRQSNATAPDNQGTTAPGQINAGAAQTFHSGGISPSKWGLTGKRNLSEGKSVFFTLEAHLNSGKGADNDFGYPGFSRQAFVGLSNQFGTITLGQQFTPGLLAFAATDPRGIRESLSGLQPWLYTSNDKSMASDLLGAFAHNSIEYQGDVDKLHIGALYGFGGKAGRAKADGTMSIGLTYSGPITVSSGYQADYANSGKKGGDKSFIGIGTSFGTFSPKLNFLNAKKFDADTGTETANYEVIGVGSDWKATNEHTLNLSFYSGKNDRMADNQARSWVISDEYQMESNLTLYAQLAFIDAKKAADKGVSILGADSLVQGAKTSVLNVGVRLNF